MTLPSFSGDPEVLSSLARVADDAGLDGVFVFDHLFRRSPSGEQRPSMEMAAALGVVAVETKRLSFGPLVARTTIRPPAVLAAELDTLARIAPGRLLATLGTGDGESREEQAAFGLMIGTRDDRVRMLVDSVEGTVGRGYPVWVGGAHEAVVEVAARMADGWNSWGSTHEEFATQGLYVRERQQMLGVTSNAGKFCCSWGGLALLGATEAGVRRKQDRLGARDWSTVISGTPEQVAERLRRFADAGAQWIILGMLDPTDPENPSILAKEVVPLLS